MTEPSTGDLPDGVTEHRITRPDGRVVAFTIWGDDGRPMLRLPGTPASRFNGRSDLTPWRERNLRMIVPERPGFGASTRLPGRGFNEHADDLAAVLDEMGIDRVPIDGASGGAPHVLAFCARHPERVEAATVVVGVAPLDESEADQLIGLNAAGRRCSVAGDRVGHTALLSELRESLLADPLAGIRAALEDAPSTEHAIMSDPDWQAAFSRNVREALRPGVDGWVDEGTALWTRWGDIDLSAVHCTLTWWHGTEDRLTRLSAAQRLVSALPNARLIVWEDEGHLVAYRKEAETLDELLARA